MNSLFKLLLICASIALLFITVESRYLGEQSIDKRDEDSDRFVCALTLGVMDGMIKNADLNLTPKQQALLPEGSGRQGEGENGVFNCDKELEAWWTRMIPFLSSLSEEQHKKLMKAFNDFGNIFQSSKRQMSSTHQILRQINMNQQANFARRRF